MRKAVALAASLALAAAMAACGEKEEPEPVAPAEDVTTDVGGGGGGQAGGQPGGQNESGKKQPPIKLTVETVLNGSAKSLCSGPAVTERYVKAAYGDVQGCEAAIASQPAFDVAVSDIEVSGDTATAKAVPDGGPNKGETIRVELVNEGGTWKVDSAVSNAPPGP